MTQWLLLKMPRPGPRPYECVRRAWHSERHRPMRGSIIQQIFRVVNEAHSAITKKNKEWQEKLPIVVLKAEDIMYSKANSEAEYMNIDTLWDRVNDAMNTIIRRDEGTETGELLPPCVEAALKLGCVPVRASRSQRHNNPGTYLRPRAQEPAPGPPKTIGEPRFQLLPPQSGNPLHFAKSTTPISSIPVSDSNKLANQNSNVSTPCSYPFSLENFPAGHNQLLTMETKTQLKLGSTYPLYYGAQYQTKDPQLSATTSVNTCSNTIFVGTPIGSPILGPAEDGLKKNLLTFGSVQLSNRTMHGASIGTQEKSPERKCDLSLRLGLFSQPFMSSEKSSACETVDVGSSSSLGGSKYTQLSPQIDREICFYTGKIAYDPFESSSMRLNSEVEDKNVETTFRKRKAPFGNKTEDGQFCRQLEVPFNQFTGHKGPGF
ncbi:Histone acetyltransferase [Quillaja saponaria]|uniref:Histone acetyltransferase n=1 Tax=Quillaja saponaria TaxID=32244 RepID=A0AAD7LEJ5_QUISA|nr:Histone acetyltransferase [Quillaja saponaria]